MGVGLGGQGGCEWRSEAFVKIQKNIFFGGGGEVGAWVRGGVGLGGGVRQGGWEQKSEACVKIPPKKKFGGGGVGSGGFGLVGQGGCEWRSEALVKIQKKKKIFFGGGGGGGGGGRVRVDGNGELKLL